MTNAQRLGEIDGMLRKAPAGEIRDGLLAERAKLNPMAAYIKAIENGSVDAVIEAFKADMEPERAKLTIAQVCGQVRDLLAECDGDSSGILQECLETLDAERESIEAAEDKRIEESYAQLPIRITAY